MLMNKLFIIIIILKIKNLLVDHNSIRTRERHQDQVRHRAEARRRHSDVVRRLHEGLCVVFSCTHVKLDPTLYCFAQAEKELGWKYDV
jgi:hypothetical protein